jgi:hypothetical protein
MRPEIPNESEVRQQMTIFDIDCLAFAADNTKREFPDDCRTGVNICAFWAFLQDAVR